MASSTAETIPSTPEQPLGMFISGEFSQAQGGSTFDVLNPATEEMIAQVAEGGPEDIDRAVSAAHEGFEALKALGARKRGRLLLDLARAVEDRFEEFAQLECMNQGKPIRHVRGFDIPNTIETFEYFGGAATKLRGLTIETEPAMRTTVRREPCGVVGQIVPWNYPIMMASWKIAPAIAAGNAVVIVPAAQTPLTLLKLAELSVEVGFPPGVLNVVTGQGPVVGDALTRHPGIGKIAFTGSTATGRLVANNASINHTPVTLELGGKSANIFFEDVDLDLALKKAVLGVFHNAGQMCLAGSRLLVHERIHNEFIDRMASFAGQMRIGDPSSEKTQVGPLISDKQRRRVLDFIEQGRASGASLAVGGEAPEELDKGFFVKPTIFTGVPPDSTIAQEEIFGPVASIFMFKDDEEAVKLANDSRYGLAAGIHTNDLARANHISDRIKAGNVWVNTYAFLTPGAPYGGYGESGYGRELGMEGIEAYTQQKTVFVSPNRG
ncbi:MAG: betaine-aldehyde dehydrogenase [Alphaproteobacteria bacterium]|nr:betaine-aldehyde dehydrogenase [Alphaproteobacteria bacterium]